MSAGCQLAGPGILRKALGSRASGLASPRAISFAAVVMISGTTPPARAEVGGVVVTSVLAGSAGDRAGIRPGDLLSTWTRGPHPPANPDEAQGSLETPLDLMAVELEQAPRGEVILRGERAGQTETWHLPPNRWGIGGKPRLSGGAGSHVDKAEALLADEKPSEAALAFRQAAAVLGSANPPGAEAWLKYQEMFSSALAGDSEAETAREVISVFESDGRLPMAAKLIMDLRPLLATEHEGELDALTERLLLRLGQSRAESLVVASVLGQVSWAARGQNAETALSVANVALNMREKLAPGSLPVADSFTLLAELAEDRGDWAAAKVKHERALSIRQAITPDGAEVAVTLDSLARVALQNEEAVVAEESLRRALAIRDRLGEESAETARNLCALGMIASDSESAFQWLSRSLAIMEKTASDAPDTAIVLGELGKVAEARNDLTAAEGYYSRCLLLQERIDPQSAGIASTLHSLGSLAKQRDDLPSAEGFLRRALMIRETLGPDTLDTASTLSSLGDIVKERDDAAGAKPFYERALGILEAVAPASYSYPATLRGLGWVAEQERDLGRASELYGQALRLFEARIPDSLSTANVLGDLGRTASARGDFDSAERFYRRCLVIQRRATPESSSVGWTLTNLGDLAKKRHDWTGAEALYGEALAMRRRVALESSDVAWSLDSLGQLAEEAGDAARAATLHREALAMREKVAPQDTALSLGHLGSIAFQQGDAREATALLRRAIESAERYPDEDDSLSGYLVVAGLAENSLGNLVAAEAYYERALDLQKRRKVDDFEVQATLGSLALLAASRADWDTATERLRAALAIAERPGADGNGAGDLLMMLGVVEAEQGLYADAENHLQRSASLAEGNPPDLSDTLAALGTLALKRGDPAAARSHLEQALATSERLAPNGLTTAVISYKLAEAVVAQGLAKEAVPLYERALAIFDQRVPGSGMDWEALHGLGIAQRSLGQADKASRYLCQALDSIDAGRARQGGSAELKMQVAAHFYGGYYLDCAETLVASSQPSEAFRVVERSRARVLLEMMGERDLLLADVPEDLARDLRLQEVAYSRAQDALTKLEGADDVKEKELSARLRDVRDARARIVGKIRETSPRVASLRYPQPLDLDGVRASLDGGTTLLSFAVGKDATLLFVVQPATASAGGLSVVSIPLGAAALGERVRSFRQALAVGADSGRGVARIEQGQGLDADPIASDLYQALIGPAEHLLERSQRLLVSADGPLQLLPFAALVRGTGRTRQYLVEWKPIHVVVSGTVYAELRKTRRNGDDRAARLIAFGDPQYPRGAGDTEARPRSVEVRAALRGGARLEPLPFTRDEVDAITGLFPGTNRKYLGSEATEERTKELDKDAKIVHFACHGIVDERAPINSALALTIPEDPREGQDNGLLQAWEIIERVRFDADLVTLSACETALGKDLGGEGLVGLTRAFQYAGARTVLASLWSVADESTARLMMEFYGHLKTGETKDEALRSAQVALMRDPKTAHPFHWAAFQVVGDWK